MKRKLKYLLPLLLCSTLAFSQSQKSARNFVALGKIGDAIVEYALLAPKASSGKAEIMLEYAYALALGGMTENALVYIDRANFLGGGADFPFYASQVLSLAGLDSLAAEFWTDAEKAPGWIAPYYKKLYGQHEQQFNFETFDPDSVYLRANQIAGQGMFVQAVVLYEDVKFFIEGYDNEFLPYVSASVVWEKLGKYGKAARELSTGIALMQQETEETQDSTVIAALPAFESHLNGLRQQATVQGRQSILGKLREKYNPKTMLYIGGMYSGSFFSFNSRFGVFIADSWNAAADLGISGGGGSTYVNLGLSVYERWKFLVGGIGLGGQFGKSTSLNVRFTSGLSFFNKTKNRSTDIFLTTDIPLRKDAKTTYGISIGRSFYFGKRKEK
ncbi:MAG: hypothetical protein LBK94_08330 [Prevotellaceae bacterium]|jgi:hypothetical protein|nr:hypothetical protein [Prevotellaceae bacterium]